jgi:hypothetical protein
MSAVDTVTTTFTTFRFLHFVGNTGLKNKAYSQLLAEARKEYGMDVEVRNIQIQGGFSAAELLMYPGLPLVGLAVDFAAGNFEEYSDYYGRSETANGPIFALSGAMLGVVLGHFQKITATGDIVRLGAAGAPVGPVASGPAASSPAPSGPVYTRLEEALDKAAGTLINEMPANATVAILNVSSDDPSMAAFVIEELEVKLVQSRRFSIVDRRQLEQIRAEQNFQISGEVSDDSAVSIGNMLGASIVITGSISRYDTAMRLILRTMDVRTARILTIAREQF